MVIWRAFHTMACAGFVGAAAAAPGIAGAPSGTRGARYLVLHGAMTALMVFAWGTAARLREPRAVAGAFRVTLVCGILARIVLIPVPSFTSSDVGRYLWDGHVALSGIDPYAVSPQQAAGLVGDWPLPAVHRDYPTLYPPLAIALFASAALCGAYAWWAWKIIVALASIATVVVGACVLRSRAPDRLSLLALSPLLVLEGGIGAHVDVVAALAIALALTLGARARPRLLGAALTAGAAMKLTPGFALGALLGGGPFRRSGLCAGAVTVLALIAAGAAALGWSVVGSLPDFLRQWRFGSPLFAAGDALGGEGLAWAFALAAGAAAFGAGIARSRAGAWSEGMLWGMAAPLLASLVVFPWYLAPIIPLAALHGSLPVLAWATTLPLSYEVLDTVEVTGRWEPALWPLGAIALGWLLALVPYGDVRNLGQRDAKEEAMTHNRRA